MNATRTLADACVGASCRSCGTSGLEPVLDLGLMPLSDGFLTAEQLAQPTPRFPLQVGFCPHCTLVQILETVPPEQLFGADYPYYSSFSESWLDHCRDSAIALAAEHALGPQSLVVELASNDGYMLRNFVERGIPTLGVDPAPGPCEAAAALGIEVRCAFFDEALAREIAAEGRRANLILANNVLAHVADTNGFVSGIKTMLAPGGAAVIEVPYVVDLIEHLEFDTIYHEHLCYFSVHALDALFSRHNLALNRVERLSTHGGSLRLHVFHERRARPTVDALLESERERGVDGAAYYAEFAARVESLKQELIRQLASWRGSGKTIAAYGAAAKGTILLNYVGIHRDTVDFVVDRNVHKQGKFVPGVDLPIEAPERLRAERPDLVLLLPWNLRSEILAQESEYRDAGGRFLIPVPWPEVV